MDITVTEKRGVATTLALCFAIALLEGLDLQSVGVAAPRMAREFGLSVAQMGWAFGAGTFGLLPGALLGGRLADRIGRKRVLIVSVCTFGLLSIATAQASSFAMLVVVRVLTGVGLGGAMPNLIALSSEAVEPRLRGSAVSAMYCGIPFGGVIASAIGVLLVGDAQWRHIFYVGGLGALGIGMLSDRLGASRVVGAMYAGIVASLVALALAPGFAGLAAAAFAAGMFVIGGQSVLYALAASHYPAAMRGTGVGAAVAAGRIGSVVGPLAAAQLLAMGRSGAVVIGASIPVTLLAAAAALLLVRRPPTAD